MKKKRCFRYYEGSENYYVTRRALRTSHACKRPVQRFTNTFAATHGGKDGRVFATKENIELAMENQLDILWLVGIVIRKARRVMASKAFLNKDYANWANDSLNLKPGADREYVCYNFPSRCNDILDQVYRCYAFAPYHLRKHSSKAASILSRAIELLDEARKYKVRPPAT